MKRNKIFAMIATMAIVISSFAGCTPKATDTATKPAAEAPKEAEKAEAKPAETDKKEDQTAEAAPAATGGLKHYGDVKLKLLNCWNGGVKNPADVYNNDVAKAIREKIGVTVEIEGIMMSETEKLNLIFASGDMPDIISAPFWGGSGGETAVIKKGASEGLLLPLDDLIGNYPNIKDAWKVGVVSQAFLENDLEESSFGGKHFILPVQTPGSPQDLTNWTYGMFAREDIIKAVGIEPQSIKTSEDLYNFFVKVRDGGFKDVNGKPIVTYSSFHNGWDLGRALLNFDDKHFTDLRKQEDGNYTFKFLTQNWMDSQMFMRRLVTENIVDKEAFKITDAQAEEKVGNGTAAVIGCQYGPVIAATKKTGLYDAHPEMRYKPIGPLTYKNGEAAVQAEFMGRGGTPCLIFPTTNKNLEASLAWVDYLNSKEGLTLASYGFENDTYTMVDGQPRWVTAITDRKLKNDESMNEELRNRGIDFYQGFANLADKRITWFGEQGPGQSLTADPDMEAYKKLQPVKQFPGYPLTALNGKFPDLEQYNILFAGEKEKEATQRAYFAATDEEATQILEEFQNKMKTDEGGVLGKYLAYINENLSTRTDFID